MDRFPASARFDDEHEGCILKWPEAIDTGVTEEACLHEESVDLVPDHSSRPRTARLWIGEALLTVSKSEGFLRLDDPVLAGDSALRESDTESMPVEF